MSEEQFSSFMDVTLFHRFQTIISMAKVMANTRRITGLSSEVSTVFSFVLIVSLSASQTVLETEEVHSWGAIVFLLKILIKHHLFISVSIPNVDIFKFSSL